MLPTPSSPYASLGKQRPMSCMQVVLGGRFRIFLVILTVLIFAHTYSPAIRARFSGERFHLSIFSSDPLVTVIVTTYNVSSYIEETLSAILNQTFTDFQLIVVDDASTDDTTTKTEAMLKNHSPTLHLKLSRNTIGGVSIPANVGMKYASGKYIAFVEGDDLPRPNYLQRFVETAESSRAEVTICQYANYFTDSNEHRVEKDLVHWPSSSLVEQAREEAISFLKHPSMVRLIPVPWRKFYRTDFMRRFDIAFPEVDYHFEDNFFHWNVLSHATRISFVPEILIDYRVGRPDQTVSMIYNRTNNVRNDVSSRVQHLKWHEASMKNVRISNLILNIYKVGYLLWNQSSSPQADAVKELFYDWVKASRWLLKVAKGGGNAKMYDKIGNLYEKVLHLWETAYIGSSSVKVKAEKQLAVVVYVRNGEQYMKNFDVLTNLSISTEVIFVDDKSEDESPNLLLDAIDRHENWYLLHAKGNGEGFAKNMGQFLCDSKYVLFIDQTHLINPGALAHAVQNATAIDADVYMLPYETAHARRDDNGNATVDSISEMEERKEWLHAVSLGGMERKLAALRAGQGHDNKLLKTAMLLKHNIHRGSTPRYSDIQHHWRSLLHAKSVQFWTGEAIIRYLSEDASVEKESVDQMDDWQMLYDAAVLANRAIVHSTAEDRGQIMQEWRTFLASKLTSARSGMKEYPRSEAEKRAEELLKIAGREDGLELILKTA